MARKPQNFELDEPDEADSDSEGEAGVGERPSRSARKRASQDLRQLGEQLVTLRPERLAELPLPERLVEAIAEARRLTSFGAQKRQAQFIGKLMRQLDEESVVAIRANLSRRR